MPNFIKILRAVFLENFEVSQKVGIGKNKFIAAIGLGKKFRVLIMMSTGILINE